MKEFTMQDVLDWIKFKATGDFYYKNVLDGQVDTADFAKLREYCLRAVKKDIAARVDGRDAWFRPIDKTLEEIIWDDGDAVKSAPLRLPMGLHSYCYIFEPALILVSGLWNQGKTAFQINVVNQNIESYQNNIFFFVSEAAELLKMRFGNLSTPIPNPRPFKIYRRMGNFADVIVPDGLNVIDYLRTDMEKPSVVANELNTIYNKLNKGIAVVAMQKPPGRGMAYGGDPTAWEPTLYISIDKGYLKFEKIKVPNIIDGLDPYKIKFQFKIRKGVNFTDVERIVE